MAVQEKLVKWLMSATTPKKAPRSGGTKVPVFSLGSDDEEVGATTAAVSPRSEQDWYKQSITFTDWLDLLSDEPFNAIVPEEHRSSISSSAVLK